MKHNPQAVTTAMQLYFSGESLRKTAESLKLIGMDVTHQTIYNWIRKYIGLMQRYLEKIKPNAGEAWRTDELFLKIKGNMKYLYALMVMKLGSGLTCANVGFCCIINII
jgi:putative transposase